MTEENIILAFCFRFGLFSSVTAVVMQLTNQPWQWKVNLQLFEALHGISRVVRLIPDKLATVQEICKLQDSSDSVFLINLVLDLARRYTTIAREKRVPDINIEEGSTIALSCLTRQFQNDATFSVNNDSLDFYQCTDLLCERLELLVEQLTTNQDITHSLNEILDIADGISAGAECFVKYVHPAMIQVARRLDFDATREQCESLIRENLTDEKCAAILNTSNKFITRMYKEIVNLEALQSYELQASK
jgi:hypothetical protein